MFEGYLAAPHCHSPANQLVCLRARPALAGREPGISAWESLVSAKHFEIPSSRSAGFAGDARPGMTSAGQ